MNLTFARAALMVLFVVGLTGSLQAQDAAAGKTVYDARCTTCHGPTGDGNAGMARALQVEIKALKSAEVQARSDDDIKMIVTGGNGKMRAVANVEGADLDNLVAYIRSLAE